MHLWLKSRLCILLIRTALGVVTSRELATGDRVHVGPFRALETQIGAHAKLFCALAKQPSSGAEETQEKAQDTHFKGQCIGRSVVSL